MTKIEQSYETYVAMCTRCGVTPASYDMWRLLEDSKTTHIVWWKS